MLQGEAKRAYQREWMRKKRAGEPTRKPPKPWQPTQRMVDEVRDWFQYRKGLRGIAYKVVAGLDPNNEDGTVNEAAWDEALRRYKTQQAEQRVRRKREKTERDAPPPPPKCSFCGEPKTAKRILVGFHRYPLICARCNRRLTATFAKLKAGKAVRSP